LKKEQREKTAEMAVEARQERRHYNTVRKGRGAGRRDKSETTLGS
jgi:hypothetical protein